MDDFTGAAHVVAGTAALGGIGVAWLVDRLGGRSLSRHL
jgi:hypothetical protein